MNRYEARGNTGSPRAPACPLFDTRGQYAHVDNGAVRAKVNRHIVFQVTHYKLHLE